MRLFSRLSVLVALGSLLLLLSACGEHRPTFEQVDENLQNPSGSVNAANTGKAWKSYYAGNSGASSNAGKGYVTLPQKLVIGKTGALSLSTYLQRAGVPKSLLPQVTTYLPLTEKLHYRPVQFVQAKGTALTPKGFPIGIPGCLGVSGDKNSGYVSINLGCGDSDASGWLTIRYNGWEDASGTAARGEIEIIFDNVCVKGDCIKGELAVRAAAKTTGGNTKGFMTMAYYLRVTEQGNVVAEGKGGFKVSVDEAGKRAKLEVVAFFKGPKREESLVLVFAAEGQNASFSIKGSNGTFTCSTSDAGVTGSCQGENKAGEKFSWSRTANAE